MISHTANFVLNYNFYIKFHMNFLDAPENLIIIYILSRLDQINEINYTSPNSCQHMQQRISVNFNFSFQDAPLDATFRRWQRRLKIQNHHPNVLFTFGNCKNTKAYNYDLMNITTVSINHFNLNLSYYFGQPLQKSHFQRPELNRAD